MRFINGILLCFIVAALMAGPVAEGFYAKNHMDCSCCNNHSRGPVKCHQSAKACLCNYQLLIQVYMPKGDVLPAPAMAGLAAQEQNDIYTFLSTTDIFHPPRV